MTNDPNKTMFTPQRIGVAVLAAVAVGLGVFFEVIPIDFILGMFTTVPK